MMTEQTRGAVISRDQGAGVTRLVTPGRSGPAGSQSAARLGGEWGLSGPRPRPGLQRPGQRVAASRWVKYILFWSGKVPWSIRYPVKSASHAQMQ
jgi:hypothetical protein